MTGVLFLTLSLWTGGLVYINKTSVDAINSTTCLLYHEGGFFKQSYATSATCTVVELKSGKSIKVRESAEAVLLQLKK